MKSHDLHHVWVHRYSMSGRSIHIFLGNNARTTNNRYISCQRVAWYKKLNLQAVIFTELCCRYLRYMSSKVNAFIWRRTQFVSGSKGNHHQGSPTNLYENHILNHFTVSNVNCKLCQLLKHLTSWNYVMPMGQGFLAWICRQRYS